jgi:hypothetical protein
MVPGVRHTYIGTRVIDGANAGKPGYNINAFRKFGVGES